MMLQKSEEEPSPLLRNPHGKPRQPTQEPGMSKVKSAMGTKSHNEEH